MKEFDDIDQLFQEEFSSFDALPDSKVKEKIDEKLFGKSKKRFLFWWIFSGLFFTACAISIYTPEHSTQFVVRFRNWNYLYI